MKTLQPTINNKIYDNKVKSRQLENTCLKAYKEDGNQNSQGQFINGNYCWSSWTKMKGITQKKEEISQGHQVILIHKVSFHETC